MKTVTPASNAARGVVGTAVLIAVVLLALNFNKLPVIGNSNVIEVQFAEAGGLKGGDAVMISGAEIGKVREVRLEGDKVIADVVVTNERVQIGDRTRAKIITITLLGRAAVELQPQGSGALGEGDVVPVERTEAPFNINTTLDQLTSTTGAIDKDQLARALEESRTTLDGTADNIGPALEGITKLTSAVERNDDELLSLLDRAGRVSDVLASRNQQIETLLGSGTSLLGQLDARQKVIDSLLMNVTSLANQLRAVLDENREVFGPALDELDSVVEQLNDNKEEIQSSIVGVQGYATAFNEAISSGPWFDAYIQNLTSPGTLAPVLSGILD